MQLAEENRIVNECLSKSNEQSATTTKDEDEDEEDAACEKHVILSKYIQLKRYLQRNEGRFVQLEQANLRAIRQLYTMLTREQKFNLIGQFHSALHVSDSRLLLKFSIKSEY